MMRDPARIERFEQAGATAASSGCRRATSEVERAIDKYAAAAEAVRYSGLEVARRRPRVGLGDLHHERRPGEAVAPIPAPVYGS